ncbi:MAG: alpha-amylase family glycosyl hydrolase [Collinsella sp.]
MKPRATTATTRVDVITQDRRRPGHRAGLYRGCCRAAEQLALPLFWTAFFNHTGDDSIYFNRYGNYPGVGAWQSEDSPWRDAFTFHEDGSYDCWWGVGNMPAINENSELVHERLLGKDGVIRKWLRAGAHGWRLDVADELSDDFLAEIKKAVLAEKPDALLLGEVWEDASNKVSYGHLRRYLQGSELDSAMDYPFRDMVIGFLMGYKNAYQAAEDIETLRENYPSEALSCALNLLSSHDRPRIISVLGGGPDESQLPECERSKWRLDEGAMGLAKSRFWLTDAHADDLPRRALRSGKQKRIAGGPYRPGQPPPHA